MTAFARCSKALLAISAVNTYKGLDAVVCAYVAMLAAKRPESITVYGEPETGRIVTPTLPEGLRPSPRTPLTVAAAQAAVEVRGTAGASADLSARRPRSPR